VNCIVLDTETQGPVMFGLAGQLAGVANAEYYKIDDLKSDTLIRSELKTQSSKIRQ